MIEVFSSVGSFMTWLGAHQNEAYIILFLGSYFETLIGPNFFIPGEIFLVSGSILAGVDVLNIWYVIIALYSGAILGDNSSYILGGYIGKSIFKEGRRIFSIKNYDKGSAFFNKHGSKAIFLARMMGPLSWITPFLAGIYKVPYKTFLLYNTPGVIIGVGNFIFFGYLFGYQYEQIINVVSKYFIFVIIVILLLAGYWLWRRSNRNL